MWHFLIQENIYKYIKALKLSGYETLKNKANDKINRMVLLWSKQQNQHDI